MPDYNLVADTVVLLHVTFVLFVLFGGLAVLQWRQLAWVHIPAALWGMLIELCGWTCPLTYLENYFRHLGDNGYDLSFIEHYLEPILYPLGLTRNIQLLFGLTVLLLNLTIYYRVCKQYQSEQRSENTGKQYCLPAVLIVYGQICLTMI